MIWQTLIQGFRLFDQPETPLRLEYRKRFGSEDTEWESAFAETRFFWLDLFVCPDATAKLRVNNLLLEFLTRDQDPAGLPDTTGIPYQQVCRFVQRQIARRAPSKLIEALEGVGSDWEQFQFRLTSLTDQAIGNLDGSIKPLYSEVLFVSPWLARSDG